MNKRRTPNRFILICAAVTLVCVVLLVILALRAGHRDEAPAEEPAVTAAPSAAEQYETGAEKLAADEWLQYRREYDPDGSILSAAIAGSPEVAELAEDYGLYLVYSAQMRDKLESILAARSLTLHHDIFFCYTPEELYIAAETPDFLWDGASAGGYVYDDGSFHLDGTRLVTGAVNVPFSLDLLRRGVFSEELLDTACAETWEFTAPDGTVLTLSQSDTQSIAFAALPNAYVSLQADMGRAAANSAAGFTPEGFESFVSLFSWALMDQPR